MTKGDREKGVRFHITREQIREYRAIPPEQRLKALEDQAMLSYLGLTPKRRAIWEKFRRGDI